MEPIDSGQATPAQGKVAEGAHRRVYQRVVHEMKAMFRRWRDGVDEHGHPAPSGRDIRHEVSPYSTARTPRMGDMSDDEIDYWAREICRRDMERTINMRNEQQAVARAKRRAGEAA